MTLSCPDCVHFVESRCTIGAGERGSVHEVKKARSTVTHPSAAIYFILLVLLSRDERRMTRADIEVPWVPPPAALVWKKKNSPKMLESMPLGRKTY